jgi:hypothetical protein
VEVWPQKSGQLQEKRIIIEEFTAEGRSIN